MTSSLTLGSSAHIDVTGSGAVTIYITGNPLFLGSNARLHGNTLDQTKATLYGTDALEQAEFGSDSKLYGGFYARNAEVPLNSGTENLWIRCGATGEARF